MEEPTSRPTTTAPKAENPIIENPEVENPKVENPCVACPNGGTNEGVFEYERAVFTCAEAISFVTRFDSVSDECTNNLADLEAICCPPKVVNPCVVCPDGAVFDGEVEEVVIMACIEVISFTMGFEFGSNECTTNLAYVEAMCCLSKVETVTTTTRIPEIEGGAAISAAATVGETSTLATATAIPLFDGGAATSAAASVGETSTSATTTAIPLFDGGAATSSAASMGETSTLAMTTAIPEINGETTNVTAASAVDTTAATTAAIVEETGTTMNTATSPESIDAASGCVTFSGFGGFAIVSIWVVYAVGWA